MGSLLDIGVGLAAARQAIGMSQRALGGTLGVKQQQIARWEATGYRTASLQRVAAVAEALGVGGDMPLAAETQAQYAAAPSTMVAPVRDLGEVAARIRALDAQLRDYGLASIGVFGSFATGEQTSVSDVDLLVVIADRDRIKGFRFVDMAQLLEDTLGRPVDVAQPHLIRERLKVRVEKEAVGVWAA